MTLSDFADEIRRRAEDAKNAQVSIAFFGQPGAGKSSLINEIIGLNVARVGVATDVTKDVERYEWNGLVLCDLPGYGTERFPSESFITRFDVLGFDVILCVSAGKFSKDDVEFYRSLLAKGRKCIFVRNKADTLFQRGKEIGDLKIEINDDLAEKAGTKLDTIFTSCVNREGLDTLASAITSQLDGVKRDRFFRAAKAHSSAFLNRKLESCKRYALWVAGTAAAVNLTPVPGVGFAADVSAIVTLLRSVKKDFGLDDRRLSSLELAVPAFAPLVSNIIRYASTDGVLFLLRSFAGRTAAQEVTKYVPLVGPMIAASLSFLTIKMVTDNYTDDCYKAAAAFLDRELTSA